jgi:Na+/H+-dicarboxylate symporter
MRQMMYMTFAISFYSPVVWYALGFGTQVSMLLVLMLTSKGIAGVPRASLVVIAGNLAILIFRGGIALLLGIDPLLDMGRAPLCSRYSIATAVVSKWKIRWNQLVLKMVAYYLKNIIMDVVIEFSKV